MNNLEQSIEEIVLKPAQWKLDDYVKAKKQLISLFESLINEVIGEDIVMPEISMISIAHTTDGKVISGSEVQERLVIYNSIKDEQRAKAKQLLKEMGEK